jgi:hypothetical protein
MLLKRFRNNTHYVGDLVVPVYNKTPRKFGIITHLYTQSQYEHTHMALVCWQDGTELVEYTTDIIVAAQYPLD